MAKMSDLTQVQNPVSGAKGSLVDPMFWVQNVVGVGFLFLVFAMGQKLANMVSGSVPLGVNTAGVSLTNIPKQADSNVQPQRVIY